MKKYDVYYYGAQICYVEAEDLAQAQARALDFLFDYVEGPVTYSRVSVFEAKEEV
ncbi:hypothetical protein [Enterococcus innesii]|nr:hypothetical protein [Enterococcus innesii]